MTAKEKANDLIQKYLNMNDGLIIEFIPIPIEGAKQCALIANNEILEYSKAHGFIELAKFHEEVKQEIENL